MADQWHVGRHSVGAWPCLTAGEGERALLLHKPGAPAEEYTREAYRDREGPHLDGARVATDDQPVQLLRVRDTRRWEASRVEPPSRYAWLSCPGCTPSCEDDH